MTKKGTKKTRRPNISPEALERARRELYGVEVVDTPVDPQPTGQAPASKPQAESQPVAPKPITARRRMTMTKDELREEYGYVISDLRSMGILAGILFSGMVVVSLIIEQLVG